MQASEAALQAALEVGASEALGKRAAAVNVDLDVQSMAPRTEQERRRRAICHFCHEPSSATNHVCPACKASVCFSCAREQLAREPRCPNCGDVERNAAVLGEYLAAGEAWRAAVGFAASVPEALTRRSTAAIGALSTHVLSTHRSRRLPSTEETDVITTPPTSPMHNGATVIQRQFTGMAQLPVSHACFLCSRGSSSLDLVCSACGVTVCTDCLRAGSVQDFHCPNCQNAEFCNAQSVRLLLNAAQVCDSAQNLWDGIVGVGRELFSGQPAAEANCTPKDGRPRSNALVTPDKAGRPRSNALITPDTAFTTTVYNAKSTRNTSRPVDPPDRAASPTKTTKAVTAKDTKSANPRVSSCPPPRRFMGPSVRASPVKPAVVEPPEEAFPDWNNDTLSL